MKQSKSIGSIVDDHIFILCFNIVGHTLDRLCQFKGSSEKNILFLKSMSERVGSDKERLLI